MRLSIRTKVLTTYLALALLVIVGLVVGIHRLQRISYRLNYLRSAYLPIVRTLDSFSHLYHLDESFDIQKILNNKNNPMFVDSLRVASPQLIEEGLRKQLQEARKALQKQTTSNEQLYLDRIIVLADELISQHRKYLTTLGTILNDTQKKDPKTVLKRNEELLQQKRVVHSKLDQISRQLDQRIQSSIFSTDSEARKAILWASVLSLITVILAALVGLIALFALRPLSRLKETAQKIAAGDLHKRVDIRSKDEVGELALEFNRMADSIEQRDEALRRQQENLIQTEKMAVVGRMASKISHEIRNPLNALSLNVEILQDEIESSEAKKTLKTMATEIDRLNKITENYLSMSRTQKINSEDVSLPNVIQNLQSFIQSECSRRKLSFDLKLSEPIPHIKADPVRLEQALINLIKNAMEASTEGKMLGLSAYSNESTVHIDVWDQGIGIPPDQMEKVFDPFFTTKDKGTGLGLSITQEIIREQGGSISVQSEPNKGTQFKLAFPI